MTHARKTVLAAFIAAVTGLKTTGARVIRGRNEQLIVWAKELPCLLVYRERGGTESSEHDADDKLMREFMLVAKGVVADAQDADELLDDIAAEIEAAVHRTLGGLVIDCIPVQTRLSSTAGPSNATYAAIEIVFRITYRTVIGVPATPV